MRHFFRTIFVIAIFGWAGLCFAEKRRSFAVMAPLKIGDPTQLDSEISSKQWNEFKTHLKEMKNLGVESVTTDIWWGLVEPEEGIFKWDYYHRMAKAITESGLKWIPILSTHQCGGNVGDECWFPLPSWIWKKQLGPYPGKSFQYVSEYGKASAETLAVWGTRWAIPLYRNFYKAFRKEFEGYALQMAEINISLGPAGELRYPSYNSHDGGVAGYPTRGALQAYSPLARQLFQAAMAKKYGTLDKLNRSWGLRLSKWEEIAPPRAEVANQKGASAFFEGNYHQSAYGLDFFDWYQDSLMLHGKMLLKLAESIFHEPMSPYLRVPMGAKIPGVHWRAATDRLAELSAGLIRTRSNWKSDEGGHGYGPLLSVFQTPASAKAPRILHFSCIEKSDQDDAPRGQSLAKTLVKWVGAEAKRQKVVLKGENALAGSLGGEQAWKNMRDALASPYYQGLTILRMADVSSSRSFAQGKFKSLIQEFSK